MIVSHQKRDLVLLLFLGLIAVGIPFLINGYDQNLWNEKIRSNDPAFSLTGNVEKGWISGDMKAYQVISFQGKELALNHPVIRVKKGENVVLKLTSSDVIHGFSLKDFDVYVEEGIYPGKVTIVTFVADKEGTFSFTCNAICGKNHEKMQGTLIVTA